MVDYKQILRLRAEGMSQRGIADVMGCSRNTVAAVFAAATQPVSASSRWRTSVLTRSATCCCRTGAADSGRVTPEFEHPHRELARPSVTLLLLWNEYVAACRACRRGAVPVLVLQ